MSEPALRVLIVGSIAAVFVVVLLNRGRVPRTRPVPISRPDLGPGVHFFASATCRPCLAARAALEAVYGDEFNEISYETDPTRFGALGIKSVPTVMALGPAGEGLMWQGVPKAGDLPRP